MQQEKRIWCRSILFSGRHIWISKQWNDFSRFFFFSVWWIFLMIFSFWSCLFIYLFISPPPPLALAAKMVRPLRRWRADLFRRRTRKPFFFLSLSVLDKYYDFQMSDSSPLYLWCCLEPVYHIQSFRKLWNNCWSSLVESNSAVGSIHFEFNFSRLKEKKNAGNK